MNTKTAFARGLLPLKPQASGLPKPSPAPQARFIPREALGAYSSWKPRRIESPVAGAGSAPADTQSGLPLDEQAQGEDHHGLGHTPYRPPTALERATAQALAVAAGTSAAQVAWANPTATAGGAANHNVSSNTTPVAAHSTALAAARQSGYQDGYRDGTAALDNFKQSFASQITSQVGALMDAFDAQLTALDGPLAQALADSATQLARELLRSELQCRPEQVAQVAAEAVGALLAAARQIKVYAHPQDLPLISQGAQEALAARSAQLLADSTLAPGGVRVESDLGSVDARIHTRWRQAAERLGSPLGWQDADPTHPARPAHPTQETEPTAG